MLLDSKELTRRTVQRYLSDASPETLQEFEVVFDGLYDTLSLPSADSHPSSDAAQPEGVAFDPGFIAGTVVSIATAVALTLAMATLKYSLKHGLSQHIDAIEHKLIDYTRNPTLVRQLRRHLDGILAEL